MSSYEILEKVLEFINLSQNPVSAREISKNLNINRVSLSRVFNDIKYTINSFYYNFIACHSFYSIGKIQKIIF